jgi:hypothetical protein
VKLAEAHWQVVVEAIVPVWLVVLLQALHLLLTQTEVLLQTQACKVGSKTKLALVHWQAVVLTIFPVWFVFETQPKQTLLTHTELLLQTH